MCAKYAEATVNSGDNYFIRLIGLIICIGAAVSVVVSILFMLRLDFDLTSGNLLLFVVVDIALVALAFVLFLSDICNHNNAMRFISFILVGLTLFVNMFLSSYLISPAIDFIDGGTYGVKSTGGAIEYSIVAQRNADIELSAKREVRAGIQSTDAFRNDAEKETKKLAAASFEEFENITEMIQATENDSVDIAVIQSAMLDAFAEYFPDSFDNLDVLATFRAGTGKAKNTAPDVKVDISKPFSVYVSGIDVEGDISQTGRSDSNMLILIDPERYRMMLINTPRDYYVKLHGIGVYPDKLTHAGIYGIDVCEQTIADLYGIEIDYHVQINFTTITTFVQSMGGIVVYNPRAFTLWGQTYKEGRIYLNGDQALLFARARKGLANGDIDRGANQQLVIEGIVDRVTSPEIVIHYKKLLDNLSGTFLSNIPPSVITQLFSRQISLGGDWTIEKLNATGTPARRPTYSMGSEELSVINPDLNSISEIQTAIDDFMRGK